jgi:hypothetical protein
MEASDAKASEQTATLWLVGCFIVCLLVARA